MSKPPGDSRVGSAHQQPTGGRSPPYVSDPIAAEIQAEIDDHLATGAEQLQSHGFAAEAALQKSQAKFGNPTAISRRCYWIKQGDALMFRTAVILLLSLLCLALGATVFTSWRAQRQTAEQMAALAEQLKLLAEQQRAAAAPLPPADAKPLEITGQVFIGSPDKPSCNTEVIICRVSDGEIVRRVSTASDGTFSSQPLAKGDYTIIAEGVQHSSWKGSMGIQTGPIYLYPNRDSRSVTIDAKYRCGRIAVELSRPLPYLKVEGKYIIDSRLYVRVEPSTSIIRETRWTVAEPPPSRWPLYVNNPEALPWSPGAPDIRVEMRSGVVLSNSAGRGALRFSQLDPLPAGECSVAAFVLADVAPDPPPNLDQMIFNNRSGWPQKDRHWMSDYWVAGETLGQIWLLTLGKKRNPGLPYTSLPSLNQVYLSAGAHGHAAELSIADGQTTKLLVEVPDDVLSPVQELVEQVTDPHEFKKAVEERRPFIHPAKITVLGTEPLRNGDASDQ